MSANTLLRFRELETIEDWETAMAIRNICWPETAATVEEAKSWSKSVPEGTYSKRFLMLDGDRGVAYGNVFSGYWQDVDNMYVVRVSSLPGEDCARWHEQLFGELSRLAIEQGAERLSSSWRSDLPEIGEWFEAQGYERTITCPGTKLDVDEFDPARFSEAVEKVLGQGVELITLNEFRERYPTDWQHQYWRLETDLMTDVPLPDPWKETPFETFLKQLEDPSVNYDTIWIAMEGDSVMGGTQIHPNLVNSSLASTGLTGVRRDYRRRGIATALKVNALSHAKRKGIKTITTDNEENNPMYQLNIDLGFKHFVDYVLVQKVL